MISNVIAVDGPAASGKGTVSRKIADALNFAFMDTGALYRAVGYEVLMQGNDPELEDAALQGVAALRLPNCLDNPALREDKVGNAASKVAALPAVRAALLKVQKDFALNPGSEYEGAVLDGRDIGTVVCVDAQLKLYVTADIAIRAERRTKELQSKGLDVTKASVLEDMRVRDARDSDREAAPMRPADDAIVIDTSNLSADEVITQALEYAKKAFVGSSA